MTKALISSLVMAVVSGCASNYHPLPDRAYGTYEAVPRAHYRVAYFDSAYYPWWSMDYFYLGSHYYRPVYGTSLYFGLRSGYPYYGPYFYPGYYSAWYAPYHYYDPWFGGYYAWPGYSRYNPYWRHGYGRHAYRPPPQGNARGHDRSPADHRGHDQGRGSYRGHGRERGTYPDERVGHDSGAWSRSDAGQGSSSGVRDRGSQAGRRSGNVRTEPVGTNRNVSVAPSRGKTDRGMVVVNRGDPKPGPNRLEPVGRKAAAGTSTRQSPASSPAAYGRDANPRSAARPARDHSTPERQVVEDPGNDADHPQQDPNPWPENRRRKDRR